MPLSDVRGQSHAVGVLQRTWASGKLHHATLLAGAAGVGKSLVARETARMILCPTPEPGPDACGTCRSCRLLDRGSNPDLLWLRPEEGKTTIGVGQVRSLRSLVELPPHAGVARVVVIDDADLMTPEAQNALLKTLEEPPSRTYLVLTTSRPESLLPTVRSRCSRIRLAPLSDEVLLEVVSERHPEASGPALRLATALAQGSVTRAGHLLEADLDEQVGLVDALGHALEQRSSLEVLALGEDLTRDKERLVTTLELLALYYRDVLAEAAGLAGREPVYEGREEAIRACAGRLGLARTAARVEAILETIEAITVRQANARLTTEAMLLRMLA